MKSPISLSFLILFLFKVWEQIKKDFNEVVHSVSEPKDIVYRTAFSVRDRITAAANTVKNLNPNEFLLPDNESETDQQFTKKGNIVNDGKNRALYDYFEIDLCMVDSCNN